MQHTLLAQAPAVTGCQPGEGGINLGDCYLIDRTNTVSSVYAKPADLIQVFVRNVYVVAGIFIFITLLFAGWKFIQSGTKGKDEAKKMASTALLGIVVMFAAYWIVRVAEVLVGQQILF